MRAVLAGAVAVLLSTASAHAQIGQFQGVSNGVTLLAKIREAITPALVAVRS